MHRRILQSPSAKRPAEVTAAAVTVAAAAVAAAAALAQPRDSRVTFALTAGRPFRARPTSIAIAACTPVRTAVHVCVCVCVRACVCVCLFSLQPTAWTGTLPCVLTRRRCCGKLMSPARVTAYVSLRATGTQHSSDCSVSMWLFPALASPALSSPYRCACVCVCCTGVLL